MKLFEQFLEVKILFFYFILYLVTSLNVLLKGKIYTI